MLFYIYLTIAVAISARPVDHLLSPKKLLKDPTSFVAAFSKADVETINRLLDMVAELISEGEDDQTDAQSIFDDATAKSVTAISNLEQATNEDNAAAADLLIKTGEAASAATKEGQDKLALDAATTIKVNAQTDADKAAESLRKISERVEKENIECTQILNLLKDLEPATFINSGRKLLSAQLVDANPEQIERIREKINKMIADGAVEVATAETADSNAKGHLHSAIASFDDALATYTASAATLVQAKAAKSSADKTKEKKAAALVEATNKRDSAADTLSEAHDFLSNESARIASEKLILNEVKELLQKLL